LSAPCECDATDALASTPYGNSSIVSAPQRGQIVNPRRGRGDRWPRSCFGARRTISARPTAKARGKRVSDWPAL